jgi:hypothetical protein
MEIPAGKPSEVMKLSLNAAVILGAAALAMVACGKADSGSAPAAPGDTPDPGYLAAPQIVALVRAPDGALSLAGRATPSSQVRLASPSGARLETTADGKGDWRTQLGPVSEPALYGLSAEADGRRIQGEGYVAILPGRPTVALLRAGSGAQVLDGAPGGTVRLLALDIDSGGATVVSGLAAAGAPVRLLIDEVVAIQAAAGADGRFSLILPKALPPGAHTIRALTAKAHADAAVTITAIAPLTDGPYRITPAGGGWRVDWMTPGVGRQTTLLLGAAQADSKADK